MQQTKEQIVTIIVSLVILMTIIGVVVLILSIYYTNTKKRLLKENKLQEAEFKQELLKTQIEVQEQTLSNVGREIHDNITQVLSFVKLNLALTANSETSVQLQKVNESRELISRAINDLRHLSKSLSFEHIMHQGLIKALEAEADRVNNSGIIKVNLRVEGDSYSLGEQRELVLFRIFQESMNNTLKHAKASRLNITLQYSEQMFNLTLEDDGMGFSPDQLAGNAGSGLKNMENRAAMMGAVTAIYSAPGSGCSINVRLDPN